MSQSKKSGDLPPQPATGKLSIPVPNILTMITESFGISRAGTVGVVVLICLVLIGAVCFFFYSAPPSTMTITSATDPETFDPGAEHFDNDNREFRDQSRWHRWGSCFNLSGVDRRCVLLLLFSSAQHDDDHQRARRQHFLYECLQVFQHFETPGRETENPHLSGFP